MLKRLRAQYEKILARMKEISDSTVSESGEVRSFNESEDKEYKDLSAKLAETKAAIDRAIAEDDAAGVVEDLSTSRSAVPNVRVTRERNCNEDGEYRGFRSLGEQALAIIQERTGHGRDARLSEMLQMRAAAGMNESVDSEGGFLVQSDFAATLSGAAYENSNLLQYCTETPIGARSNRFTETYLDESSRADGSRNGGVVAKWEGEAEAATVSKPKLVQDELKLKKLIALCPVTDEQMEDTTALESELIRIYGNEIGFKLDAGIVEGDGVGKPKGILESDALVQVAKGSGQAADTVIAANIESIWAQVLSRSKAKGVWLINSEVQSQLGLMTVGQYPVFTPPQGLKDAPFGLLKGRPVIECEQCSKLGDYGDIVFADLSMYRVITKGQMKVATSIHMYFDTAQQAIRFTFRANGHPMLRQAITPYKGTSGVKYSAFVTVQNRA